MLWFRKKQPAVKSPPFDIAVSMLSDVGCCRASNQDSGAYMKPNDPGVQARKGVLVVVADGVGGNRGGEVASKMGVDVVSRVYYGEGSDPGSALQKAFMRANAEIYARAQGDPALQGMGTTCVALALRGDRAWYVHVGDSRLYLVRNGTTYLMTQDDSAVMEMVRGGMLTLEEARRHSDKNVILRALGTRPDVAVNGWDEPLPVKEGDRFLLCTDGLYDLVDDDEIRGAAESGDIQRGCETLVEIAKSRGGFDNITAGLVEVRSPDRTPRAALETRPGSAQV